MARRCSSCGKFRPEMRLEDYCRDRLIDIIRKHGLSEKYHDAEFFRYWLREATAIIKILLDERATK